MEAGGQSTGTGLVRRRDPGAGRQGNIPPSGTQASVTIDTDTPAKIYSPMIFGGFLEHFGRQIYGGVYEPGSPLSDKDGFRKDVVAALKELKTPVVRWPGGCYVSGYHWEEGVGKDREPTDDMAWGVLEPNTFGTDEFVKLSRLVGWEPYICNNAGNGTVEEMRNWVEYCNAKSGRYAQMRKENGHAEPLNVNIWSIGNENWGRHEIGYKPIEQWAPFVLEAAKGDEDRGSTNPIVRRCEALTGMDPALAEGGRTILGLHLNPFLLAASLAEERHARLPDLHHEIRTSGGDHCRGSSAYSRNPATGAESRSPSTSGICAVGITRGSRARRSRIMPIPKSPGW